MNEHDHDLDDSAVRDLLEAAGPREPIPPAHLEAIASAAQVAWKRKLHQREAARTPWLPKPRALAVAALLALTVGLGGWWLWRPAAVGQVVAVRGEVWWEAADESRRLRPGEPIPAGAEVVTAASENGGGNYLTLQLADATRLRLDSGTRLEVVSPEVVELAGGAVYIETEPGSSAAGPQIEVRTPLGSATDIGTRFSVRLRPPEGSGGLPALEVRVRDGAVLTAQDGRTWRTEAGHGLALGAGGAAEAGPIQRWGAGWDWVLAAAPAFELEGRTLGEMLDWVAHETGWEIELAEPDREEPWRAIVLHGSFGEAGDATRPDRMPFTVLPGAGLEAEFDGGRLIVRAIGPAG